MKLSELKREYEVSILDGIARTLWVMAYASFVETNGRCMNCGLNIYLNDDVWVAGEELDPACDGEDEHVRDDEFWPTARRGGDWDKVAIATPAAAYACATQLCARIVELEGMSMADLFELAMQIDQGEFEWFEEEVGRGGGDRDSKIRRKEKEAKHEAAYELGSGIAHQSLGSGVSWGDDRTTNRKTERGAAKFDPEIPRVEFTVQDFDVVVYSVEGMRDPRSASDSIARNISIGSAVPAPHQRYYGDEELEIDPDDLQGYGSIAELAANALHEETPALEASSDTYVDGVFYRGVAPTGIMVPGNAAARPVRTLVLNGFFPFEREWTYYLVTEKIGRIHVIGSPNVNGDSGDFDKNFVLWFGQIAPTLCLVFTRSLETALGVAVDFMEDKGWEGNFCDAQVHEEYQRLIVEACTKHGFPDEDMLSDREREKIMSKAEADTTQAGNHSRYISSEEWGVYGENLTLEQLRAAGGDGAGYRSNPHRARQMKIADIERAVDVPPRSYARTADDTRRPTVKITPLPFSSSAPSAAPRSRR